MEKNKLSFDVSKLKKMYKNGTLTWNESIQRCTGAWKPAQKSALIHSMLTPAFYIPSLCFLRKIVPGVEGKKDTSVYSVADGKQRLSVVFSYMDNEFKLHKTTPSIMLDDEEYVLAGKKYNELSEKLQNKIKDYVFEIASIEECTEAEKELLFFRLNDGTPLTKVQKSRAKMGGEVAGWINSLLEYDFFKKCGLTNLQRSREDNLTALLQAMMLLDDSYEWVTLGADEVAKYSLYIKENLSLLTQVKINESLKFLSEIEFEDEDKKHLKRINIPIVIKAASEAIKYEEMEDEVFMTWFEEFFKADGKYAETYNNKYCGEGSVNKDKVDGRVKMALTSMDEVLNFKENTLIEGFYEEIATACKGLGYKYVKVNN